MHDYIVRPATRADIAPLDAMFARSYPKLLKADYPPSVLIVAIPIIARAQAALVTSGTYYVAETPDGRLLAAGGWSRSNPHGGAMPRGHAHLRHFATEAEATGQGIGRAIFDRCLTDATAAGITGFECYSTLTAVPFYTALGFRKRADIQLELRPGILFPARHMERGLRPAAAGLPN